MSSCHDAASDTYYADYDECIEYQICKDAIGDPPTLRKIGSTTKPKCFITSSGYPTYNSYDSSNIRYRPGPNDRVERAYRIDNMFPRETDKKHCSAACGLDESEVSTSIMSRADVDALIADLGPNPQSIDPDQAARMRDICKNETLCRLIPGSVRELPTTSHYEQQKGQAEAARKAEAERQAEAARKAEAERKRQAEAARQARIAEAIRQRKAEAAARAEMADGFTEELNRYIPRGNNHRGIRAGWHTLEEAADLCEAKDDCMGFTASKQEWNGKKYWYFKENWPRFPKGLGVHGSWVTYRRD